jgi:hypothetical protein
VAIEMPPNVCHAIRNLDPQATAFFAAYYVMSPDKIIVPDRDICRKEPKAFLPSGHTTTP